MESTPVSQAAEPYFWLRFSLIIVGYAIAISGPLLIFSAPLYMPFLCIIGGWSIVISIFGGRSFYSAMRPRKRLIGVIVLGYLVILAVLSYMGEDRIRHWRPYPGGYPMLWVSLVLAVHHVQYLLSRNMKQDRKAA